MHRLVLVLFLCSACSSSISVQDFQSQAVERLVEATALFDGMDLAHERATGQMQRWAYFSGVPIGTGLSLAELNKLLASGKVHYDASKAKACLDSLEAYSTGFGPGGDPFAGDRKMQTLRTRRGSCAALFTGTVVAGGSCTNDVECAGGYCDAVHPQPCPGTCRPFGATGASCRRFTQGQSNLPDDAMCADGLFCTFMGNEELCEPAGTGAAAGASCNGLSGCQSGLACISSKCAPPLAAGAACAQFEYTCDSGLYCDSTGHCKARANEGGACDLAGGGLFWSEGCVGNLVCVGGSNPPGACRTPQQEGGPCVHGATPNGCFLGLVCNGAGKCAQPPGAGQPCPDGVCAASAFCSSGACVALQDYNRVCALGGRCRFGVSDCQGEICPAPDSPNYVDCREP